MGNKVVDAVIKGPALDDRRGNGAPIGEEEARLTAPTIFQEDTDPPLRMADIEAALVAKRAEQKEKLKRLATLAQEMCDILNTFDA